MMMRFLLFWISVQLVYAMAPPAYQPAGYTQEPPGASHLAFNDPYAAEVLPHDASLSLPTYSNVSGTISRVSIPSQVSLELATPYPVSIGSSATPKEAEGGVTQEANAPSPPPESHRTQITGSNQDEADKQHQTPNTMADTTDQPLSPTGDTENIYQSSLTEAENKTGQTSDEEDQAPNSVPSQAPNLFSDTVNKEYQITAETESYKSTTISLLGEGTGRESNEGPITGEKNKSIPVRQEIPPTNPEIVNSNPQETASNPQGANENIFPSSGKQLETTQGPETSPHVLTAPLATSVETTRASSVFQQATEGSSLVTVAFDSSIPRRPTDSSPSGNATLNSFLAASPSANSLANRPLMQTTRLSSTTPSTTFRIFTPPFRGIPTRPSDIGNRSIGPYFNKTSRSQKPFSVRGTTVRFSNNASTTPPSLRFTAGRSTTYNQRINEQASRTTRFPAVTRVKGLTTGRSTRFGMHESRIQSFRATPRAGQTHGRTNSIRLITNGLRRITTLRPKIFTTSAPTAGSPEIIKTTRSSTQRTLPRLPLNQANRIQPKGTATRPPEGPPIPQSVGSPPNLSPNFQTTIRYSVPLPPSGDPYEAEVVPFSGPAVQTERYNSPNQEYQTPPPPYPTAEISVEGIGFKTKEPRTYVACPSDVLFVIDSTASVREKWQKHLAFVASVIEGLVVDPENDRVAAIVYSSKLKQKIKIKFTDHSSREELLADVKALPFFSGVTATGAALKFASQELANRRVDKTTNVVVITDGFSYDLVDEPAKEIQSMHNVRMFGVTVQDPFNRNELEIIAGSPERVLHGVKEGADELVRRIRSCAEGQTPPPIKEKQAEQRPAPPKFRRRVRIRGIRNYHVRRPIPTRNESDGREGILLGSNDDKLEKIIGTATTSSPSDNLPATISSGAEPESTTYSVNQVQAAISPEDVLSSGEIPGFSSTGTFEADQEVTSGLEPSFSGESEVPETGPEEITSSGEYMPAHEIETTVVESPDDRGRHLQAIAEEPRAKPIQAESPTQAEPAPLETRKEEISQNEAEVPVKSEEPPQLPQPIKPIERPAAPPVKEQETEGCAYDVVIVLDASGSLTTRFTEELQLTANLINKLVLGPKNAQVSVIKYAGPSKVRILFGFQDYQEKQRMMNTVMGTRFISGITRTNEALMSAVDQFKSEHARPGKAHPVAIIFTDGFSSDDVSEGARMMRDQGVTVYAIAVTKGMPINIKGLETIAGSPSRVYRDDTISNFLSDFNDLTSDCIMKN